VLMGIGIASMHYTGMAAMETFPPIQYDPLLFCASIVIAIGASLAALWIAFTLRTESVWMIYAKYAAAVIMGAAITGIVPDPDPIIEDSGPGIWPKLEKPKQEKLVHNVCTAHGMYKQYYGTSWRCKR